MYQISRSIYRELEADIVEDRQRGAGPTNRERVLRACEAAVHRLATDRHYFARPSRTLFNDILLPDRGATARLPRRRLLPGLRGTLSRGAS